MVVVIIVSVIARKRVRGKAKESLLCAILGAQQVLLFLSRVAVCCGVDQKADSCYGIVFSSARIRVESQRFVSFADGFL